MVSRRQRWRSIWNRYRRHGAARLETIMAHFTVEGCLSVILELRHEMPSTVDIGTLIERSPEIRDGRPCIAGTGVSVHRIAVWHDMGLSPEKIAAEIDHLDLAQVYAALAYYFANRQEIDRDLADDDAIAERLEAISSRKA
jgi:uncharacterized protein (DUF433 family)